MSLASLVWSINTCGSRREGVTVPHLQEDSPLRDGPLRHPSLPSPSPPLPLPPSDRPRQQTETRGECAPQGRIRHIYH